MSDICDRMLQWICGPLLARTSWTTCIGTTCRLPPCCFPRPIRVVPGSATLKHLFKDRLCLGEVSLLQCGGVQSAKTGWVLQPFTCVGPHFLPLNLVSPRQLGSHIGYTACSLMSPSMPEQTSGTFALVTSSGTAVLPPWLPRNACPQQPWQPPCAPSAHARPLRGRGSPGPPQ